MNDEAAPARVADYDEFVDWDKRLSNEGPFFKRVFEDAGVRSVIDVGAGSARHAIMFASWGLDVIAVDPDDSMLAAAEANIARLAGDIEAGGGSVTLQRGGFGELGGLGLGPVDALVCTGNALPHVAGRDGLTEALADFGAVVAPGGVLVLHLLNHARLLASRTRAIQPKVRDIDDGVRIFLRVIDYPAGDEFLDFDFVTMTRDKAGEWTLSSRRSAHTVITPAILGSELPCSGFSEPEVFGDHSGRALDPDRDESVIAVARKR